MRAFTFSSSGIHRKLPGACPSRITTSRRAFGFIRRHERFSPIRKAARVHDKLSPFENPACRHCHRARCAWRVYLPAHYPPVIIRRRSLCGDYGGHQPRLASAAGARCSAGSISSIARATEGYRRCCSRGVTGFFSRCRPAPARNRGITAC